MSKPNTDPYIQKKSEYEHVTDNLNIAKRNWQVLCYVLTFALILSIGCNYYTSSKAHIVPYVVQVDDLGRALATTEAKETTMTDDRVIKAFVYQYIDNARSIVSDPETLKNNLLRVYRESIKSVQTNFLTDYYLKNDPYQYAQKKGTRHIEPIVFLKEGENTYSIEWREIERSYDNEVLSETHYKALLTVIQVPNTNEDQFKEDPLNPFGLYVTSLSWSQLT